MKNRRRRRVSDFRPDLSPRTGHVWFEEKDYARILEILRYPEGMPRDYNRWREVTENNERFRKRRGRFDCRIVVDPERLLGWCAARSIEPSSAALSWLVFEALGFPLPHTLGIKKPV